MPAADAPIRAPARRRPRPKRTPAAAIRHATARGPQGLPIQSKSPQRARPVRPLTRTTRGPQGLRIQHHTPQKPRQRPLRSLPHPKPRPSGRAQRLNATGGGYEAALRRGQRERKNNNTAAANVLHALLADPKRELEGRGALAAALGAISRHTKIRPGGQDVTYSSMGIGTGKTAQLPQRVAHDLINAPAQVLPSLYVPAKAAVKAVGGDTREAKKFIRDLKANDPIYNLVTGNVNKALRLANEHPGYTALEGTGFLRGADMALGKTARSGVAGGRVKQAATRRRPARVSETTEMKETRFYPKGLVAKAAVRGRENAKREHAANLRRTADRIENDAPDRAKAMRREANRKDPDVMQPREIKRQVTELFSAREELRREHRGRVLHDVEEEVTGTPRARRATRAVARARGKQVPRNLPRLRKSEEAAMSVVTQRITTASKDDIRAYMTHLEHEHSLLDDAGRRDNEALRRQLKTVLKDERYSPSVVENAARSYQRVSQRLQDKLVESELITREEADLARLTPYAARNMKAKFHDRPDLVEAAQEKVRKARENLKSLQAERSRIVGRHQVHHGQAKSQQRAYYVGERRFDLSEEARAYAKDHGGTVRTVGLTVAESKRLGEVSAIDRKIARRRELVREAESELRRTHEEAGPALRLNGKELTVDDIRAHMRDNNVKEPAFLTQAPNQRGARNFNIRGERMQTIRSERRTGAATTRGVFDPHPDTLKENAAKARGLVDAVETWSDFINQVAVREPGVGDIKPLTYKDAQRRVENIHARGSKTEYAVIRAYPFGTRKALVDKLLDSKDPQQIAGYKDLMDEALNFDDPKGDQAAGQWIVVPKAAAEELRAHLSAMAPTTFEKAWSAWNQTFRSTVLATSSTWLLGNLSEAGLRAAVARAGPRSYLTAHRVLKELRRLDPEVAEMAVARTVAGGHMSFSRRAMRYSNGEQFERTNLEGIAESMGKLRRTRGPKQIADAWNHYTDWVFNSLNGRLESQFQMAMLGRAIRDSPLMDEHMFKLSKKAINEAAQGLRETSTQIAFGRQVDRMYGKYGKFNPTMRRVVAYYTPFLAWSLNAATFVYSVLPKDHPVVTSLILSTEQATEEWRKDHGLDLYMAGANPAFLQGSIPGRTKNYPVSRFTPFGAFGDYVETLASNVLPQVSAFLDIGKHGIDFKGQTLRNPRTGEPLKPDEKLVAIGRAFAESTIPLVGLGQRIADKGPIGLLGGAAGYKKGKDSTTQSLGNPLTDSLGGGSDDFSDSLQSP